MGDLGDLGSGERGERRSGVLGERGPGEPVNTPVSTELWDMRPADIVESVRDTGWWV